MPETTPNRMGAFARSVRDRTPRLPRLPEQPEREIVVQTTPARQGDAAAVPQGIRLASEWTWRMLLIGVGILALLKLVSILSVVVFPVIVAVLLAALLDPIFTRLRGVLPRGLAAIITVLGTLAVLIALFSFVVNQFANQLGDLTEQVGKGVEDIRIWIEGTFGISQGELSRWMSETWAKANENGGISKSAAQAGLTAGHVVTGFFLAMFALFFFLYDGPGIWAWIVRLFPRTARTKVLSSGRIAWGQLKAFTRATILVAAVDAAGIGIGAALLGVPFASGIALLTFVGAFVPVVGALASGFIAVVLALVAKGPIAALAMLGVTVLVQQAESHLLQPLLLGRAVRVHPLAVILGIATGVIVGGIFGALVAVPLIAVLNAVGHNLLDPEPTVVSDPSELTTPAEEAEVEQDVAEIEELAEMQEQDAPDREVP